MSNAEEVIFIDVDCECECAAPVAKHHHEHAPVKNHHHKEEVKEVKADKDVEKVVPEKEAQKDSAPDVTVKLTKEEVVKEVDDKDGYTVPRTIEHNNSSEVTSQERDLTTASVTSNEESLFQQQTTVFILPAELITPANTTSEGSSSYNVIDGTSGSDTLRGSEGNDLISGLAGNDVLFGFSGDDILDGGAGEDKMNGGSGNDVYYVDNVSDQVVEDPNFGLDRIYTSVSYSLPNNVEEMFALGTANINLTGNAGDNYIVGNSGANIISGLGGADTMVGGLGSDNYVVDNAGDLVIEYPGEGIDSVFTSISYVIPDNVEFMLAQGTGAITLTGNGDANFLAGAQGNNVLIGAGGADTFVFDLNLGGGFGNDTVNDFTFSIDKLLFRGVVDIGLPGLNIFDLIAMETSPVAHVGSDTVFTFATGTVTLAGVNVSNFDDPMIAAQVLVEP